MNSYTKNSISILIFVRILLCNNKFIRKLVQILFWRFLENGNRYRVDFFRVHYYFNELSKNVSHFDVV